MGEKITLNLDSEQVTSLEAVGDDLNADSRSEAGRVVISKGLEALGYTNGRNHNPETRLRGLIRELGRLFAYSAIGYAGIAILLPVALVFQWVLLLALLGIGCIAVEQALANYEPALSERLFGARGGSTEANA